ncbi:helix-turn-helix domain-containing protein [Variovorax sp. dw_308]|uniref:helix-turn-helix domain-containing protein n=1 Tax=Variovorax sp. dw_308 TaxID=2721546 RepID=UPI001C4499DA|nr:AraC family transcriptional regulator [Variovorax sp. dw_308]
MNTYSSASVGQVPVAMNILVSHSNALVAAGLVATMQRIHGCDVQFSAAGDDPHFETSLENVDLLISDSDSLVRSARTLSMPKIVLLTATAECKSSAAPLPPGISACLPMNCGQDDLLKTVCGLIGSDRPGLQDSPAVRDHARTEPTTAARPQGGIAPSALRRVREHIENHLGEHIEVGHLATLTRLSACHFSRAFKQSVGMPPHRYVTSRRVLAAAKLIESTDRPMSEIALELGFSDQSHFTRVFTAHIGESPRRFRHQHR